MASYGIPYMGSKDSIVHKIAKLFPAADNFYDLFGGGFSVSHFMLCHHAKRYKRIFYNEPAPGVADLVRDAVAGKYNYKVFKPKWISAEEFKKNKDNCAYTRCLWSFGNNQKGYLFSDENETNKRSLHQAVVFNEFDERAIDYLKIKSWPAHLSIRGRRLACRQIIVRRKGELQQLEQLERLQQLEISNQSYDEIQILPNAVIYCDPPYKNTAGYLGSFNHEKFWTWVRVQTEPVFVSEYTAPADIKVLMAVNKKTRLSAKGMTDAPPEKVFGNEAAAKVVFAS